MRFLTRIVFIDKLAGLILCDQQSLNLNKWNPESVKMFQVYKS